jgi:hypothetical protein
LSATLPTWAAELAQGNAPGRIYVVEPTGPFADDPDLTDKRFAGNPTKSYRSRYPLRVVGEVKDWPRHSPEEIKVMTDALERRRAEQDQLIARIPSEADFNRIHSHADAAARAWAQDTEFRSCRILMLIRGVDVEVFSAITYLSSQRGESRVFELPRPIGLQSGQDEGAVSLSGRVTDVTAWREGWAAVIESCVTEIGLSLETRVWIAVDALNHTLTFSIYADGPERSWRRNLVLAGGVLADIAHGEIWNFARGSFRS